MQSQKAKRAQPKRKGELAQLARAPDLHSGGHRFDSDILHNKEGSWKWKVGRVKWEVGRWKSEKERGVRKKRGD